MGFVLLLSELPPLKSHANSLLENETRQEACRRCSSFHFMRVIYNELKSEEPFKTAAAASNKTSLL